MLTFTYAGELSSDYGLYAACFTSSPDAVGGSELSMNSVNVVGTDEFRLVNNTYSSAISYTFQVAKMHKCDFCEITAEEYSAINRWLNRRESHEFSVDTLYYEGIRWFGSFNCKPIEIGDKVYGIELTFTSTYPYGFADTIQQTYTGKTYNIYNHSDEVGVLLPTVTMKFTEAGNLILTNTLDNEITKVGNVSVGETLTFDSKHKVITSSDVNHKVCKDFNFNFPKLENTYDERLNKFESNLNATFTITYAPIRKVGIS